MDGRSLAGYSSWVHKESDMTDQQQQFILVIRKQYCKTITKGEINFFLESLGNASQKSLSLG